MRTKSELQKRIKEIKTTIAKLTNEKEKLEKELCTIEKREATSILLQSISQVSQENSICKVLTHSTKTTPIMDKFYESDNLFLIFKEAFRVSFSCYKSVSLVITKSKYGVLHHNSGLTMTDLKQKTGAIISERALSYLPKESRLLPLYQEIIKIDETNLISGNKVPFDIPCLLGGQTFRNQSGFGSEYNGDTLVYSKEYGETTKFLIIGVIVD